MKWCTAAQGSAGGLRLEEVHPGAQPWAALAVPRILAVLWHNPVPVTPATACSISASPAKLMVASRLGFLHKETAHLRKNKEPLVKGVKQKPETKKINSGS